MIFRRAVVAGTFALLAAVAASAAAARADQAYAVDGRDTFRAGNSDVRSETVYRGVQRLSITRSGRSTTYDARVEYDRTATAESNISALRSARRCSPRASRKTVRRRS